ncbi:MAG: hypothetical protein QW348_00010 [Ignisphaera sp.]
MARWLDIGKSTVHKVLQGSDDHCPELRIKLHEVFSEELLRILKGLQILRHYGLVDEEERLNKTVVLAVFNALMQDETLKEDVLNHFLKCYKQDIMERICEQPPL